MRRRVSASRLALPVVLSIAMLGCSDNRGAQSASPPVAFRAAMASALQYDLWRPEPRAYRIPFTAAATGARVRIAFSGNGEPVIIHDANIAIWQGDGAVVEATPLTFDGARLVAIAKGGGLAISDPARFRIEAGRRYALSFVASGGVPAGMDIANDGVSTREEVPYARRMQGTPERAIRLVKWVAVESPPSRVFAVLGDSIGAGASADALEQRYIALAQARLGVPIIDASRGGAGVLTGLRRLDLDVLGAPGVTDCIVALGTNDLHREDANFIISNLRTLYARLRAAGVRPWGATILPRSRSVTSPAAERARLAVNRFIRTTDLVDGVVDFAAAASASANESWPQYGLFTVDGIHPNASGHRRMAEVLASALAPTVDGRRRDSSGIRAERGPGNPAATEPGAGSGGTPQRAPGPPP